MKIEMTAISPIVHGEFSDGIDTGNFSAFRRLPMIHSGKMYEVPVLSGNALRGSLRRLLAQELVSRLNLKEKMGKAFDKFYIAVANGGNLDKTMDVAVDVEGLREMRKMFPLLSLFGSALYKYMLPGMMHVGFAIPRCVELNTGDIPLYKVTSDIGLTRHLDKTIADAGDAKPMPYTIETVVPGTEFDVTIDFEPQTTEIECACLNHGLKKLDYIGGKNAAGFGKVKITGYGDDTSYCEWMENPNTVYNLIQFAEGL